MNDYWNDPPEYPDTPECCEDEMTILEDGICICEHCGKRIEPELDIEPMAPDHIFADEIYLPSKCPHGNDWGDCGPCDHEGDLAYDAARERK